VSAEQDRLRADAVAAVARDVAPPALSHDKKRVMVQTALLAGTAKPTPRPRVPQALAAAAAAIALVALGASSFIWLTEDGDAVGELTELTLPTGDVAVATEGSRFRFEQVDDVARRVALDEGTMVFDVAPLEEGARFEVETSDVDVVVHGTVFEVRAAATGTAIFVYEGRVEVRHRGHERLLDAGESFTVGEPPARDERIARVGRDSARRRAVYEEATRLSDPPPSEPTPTVTETVDEVVVERPETLPPVAVQPEELRRMIASGDPGRALDLAREARRAADRPGRYWLVEADALRALERFGEAAEAYERGAALSGGAARATAGYRAAALRANELFDCEGALGSLDVAQVDGRGSPLEERGLALRVRCLDRLGWDEAAQMRARTYLNRFPNGSMAGWMRSLTAR